MAHPHHRPAAPKTPPSPFVEATFVFRDTLKKPIAGLAVQIKAGAGAPDAPAWKTAPDIGDLPASAPGTTSAAEPMVSNQTQATTNADGYAVTIQNAARGQPIDVLVQNRHGQYVWKATVKPTKDIAAFTIVSPEYHLEATTKLTPTEAFQQDLNLPVVQDGEVMTIERLVNDFGPYIGWTQKVTEQGEIRKDFPERKKNVTEDAKTHKKKTKITIEHHYRIIDTGKPKTVALNVLGSRLNYPRPETFSEDQYKYMATQLGVEIAAIKAIVQQESQGHPFMENGLPTILYERTYFYRLAVLKLRATKKTGAEKNPYPAYPDLCFKTHADGEYGGDGLHQYEKLARAAKLDLDLAIQSCSWGGFQIMGDNYDKCGCNSSIEFADRFLSGTDGQMNIFILFMKNVKPQAVEGLKKHEWEKVATYYNGGGWKKKNPHYATNLAKYYVEFK
ncbi:N-acetylmuramidase family protein [Paraburkholderia adhaesiva]|uniref:N-acetylmuramidase family protein n=1 Tax=Paraburkholderia adhaesiva TaxID=2883244 RepID=UPI001F2E2E48|nr:N-acetylmuramidase family protein [Paraburkholderia adhaesiva]